MSQFTTDILDLRLCDNMELMAQYPDKHFDLAIVDPPYDFSIGDKTNFYVSQGKYNKKQETRPKGGFKIGGNYMDSLSKAPQKEYFDELFRVSKNQIVWGGNYFCHLLPPKTCWVVWNKKNGASYFADAELAWTSFGTAVRMFDKRTDGQGRVHPTQKPVALYKWLLHNYAKQGDKILDTHLGSMSIAIACHDYGFHLTGCELDPDYFAAGVQRVQSHIKQLTLF